jgi:hypothetical protein
MLDGKHCIDVAISAPWSGQQRDVLSNVYSRKSSLYEEWSHFYELKCYPIVFSIFGNPHKQTRAIIENWEKTLHCSYFSFELISAINRALIHGLATAIEAAICATRISTASQPATLSQQQQAPSHPPASPSGHEQTAAAPAAAITTSSLQTTSLSTSQSHQATSPAKPSATPKSSKATSSVPPSTPSPSKRTTTPLRACPQPAVAASQFSSPASSSVSLSATQSQQSQTIRKSQTPNKNKP